MATALSPATNLLFGALKTRFASSGVGTPAFLPGGIVKEEQFERAELPYGVLQPISDVTQTRTNTTEYRVVTFTLAVIADTFEIAGALLGRLDALIDSEPLALDGGNLLKIWHGDVNFPPRENQKEKATLTYLATVGLTRDRKFVRQ